MSAYNSSSLVETPSDFLIPPIVNMPALRIFKILLLSQFSIMLALSLGCESDDKAVNQEPRVNTTVVSGSLHVVALETLPYTVRTQGSLVADEVATIGTKVAGRVVKILADLGDQVPAGSPLLQLDSTEFQLQVSQSEAQLTQSRSAVGLKPGDPLESLNPDNAPPVREARAVWEEAKQAVERARSLAERDAISDTELDFAEAAERVAEAKLASAQNGVREKIALIGVAQAQLGLAQERLREATIYAPFGGMVQGRQVAEGSLVQTGQTLFTIVRVDRLRFRASVPERYAGQLKIGQQVVLKLEQNLPQQQVTVTRISPTIDLASRSLMFEAQVPNENGSLQTGLFAEADVVLDPEAKQIAVPIQSIVRFAGVDKVWKLKDSVIVDQPVQLGRKVGQRVQVLSGIEVGDSILLDGALGRSGKFQSSVESEKN
jgi:RND family efflux transporter MFP subunit